MIRDADQIVKQRNMDDVDSPAWAAFAAHRFAMRTALAPRPQHQCCATPGARAGLASQLNRWPRAGREEYGGAACSCSTSAGVDTHPRTPTARSNVPWGNACVAIRWLGLHPSCSDVVYTN